MKTMPLWLAVLASAVLAASCVDGLPPTAEFLVSGTAEFTASVSKSSFVVGDTATLSFVLRNIGSDTLSMSFRNGCPVLYYVQDNDANLVFPTDGPWSCPAVASTIVLAPGQTHVVAVVVRGGDPDPAIVGEILLPAGRFRAYAELTNDAGRTNSVPFTIR